MEEFENFDEFKKMQTEWALLNLVRELRGISNKGATPTYYSAIKLASQIIPEIFNEKSLIVQRHHEPDLVRSFRQKAEAQSKLEGRTVEAIEIVDQEILKLNQQIGTEITDNDLLKKELDKVQLVRSLLVPRNVQEDYILEHDVKSFKFDIQPIEIGAKHADYKVSENRIIRVRLIHPNDGEQSMGADLIYEQYDQENKKVRFSMIQYKIWDGELLYWSQAKNLDPQLKKMEDNLCRNDFCKCENGNNYSTSYRYPYCSAFLRPTDKLQFKNSKFTSSGMHIPICKINGVTEESKDGNKILKKKNMKETSLSHKVFEENFNLNQIGSRWMSYTEAEKLYKEHKILEDDERIIVHVQELEM
ncbi:hypothetical protein ACHRV6_02380 [Flavobacterium sp. FlaQc-51]|uniref:hypothetical protein n=1 Tax=Flavobacterium sp. FlaQc-51 TaxID=3374184 RepID=UPI003756EB12